MNMIKEKMISWIVGMMLEQLTPEQIKKWVDMGLDMLEDMIANSDTKIDDQICLPLIKLVRDAFNVPDNDTK